MPILQGQVENAVTPTRANGNPNVMQAQLGELWVSEILPRYAAMAWSGLVFYAANTQAQALSVASSTFTGLAIGNPAGSGKNLVLIDVEIAIAAVGAVAVMLPVLGSAPTVALTTSYSTGPNGLSTLMGSGKASIATVGANATLAAAPTVVRPEMGFQWITAGVGMWNLYVKDEVGGALIVPPGQMLCLEALVGACSVVAAATWAELPI